MFNQKYYIMDLKNLLRDPFVALLSLLPLVITMVFSLGIFWGLPFVEGFLSLDLSLYIPYAIAFVMVISAEMLGVVMGFMMLNDKDGHIIELMSVTPFGRSGYVATRMGMVAFLNIFYNLLIYGVLGRMVMPWYTLFALILVTTITAVTMGLMLYVLASDKVKGLTWAKFLNVWSILVFSDLLKDRWMIQISSLFPTYWIGRLIRMPFSGAVYIWTIITSVFWLMVILIIFNQKKR